jgi:DNA-binding PadR family transcriptional regulator
MPEKSRKRELTTPDLVVLGFLMEKPMHGYQIALALQERQVKDWAGVSKPQVYYSLKKLKSSGLIHGEYDEDSSLGPERCVFSISPEARVALTAALNSDKWATSRLVPPFSTWAMLSVHAERRTIRHVIERRRTFLRQEIAKERQTIADLSNPNPQALKIAASMIELAIKNFELELSWLDEFEALFDDR